jgi:hypothetical protein
MNLASGFQSIETWHVQVKNDEIWPPEFLVFDCFAAVPRPQCILPIRAIR